MSGDEARCLFCGKPSSEGVSWAVGYATGLTEGMSKLCDLRAAVRKYLESQAHLESFGYQTEELAELKRLITFDEL